MWLVPRWSVLVSCLGIKQKKLHPHHLYPPIPVWKIRISGSLVAEVALDQLLRDVLEQNTKIEEEKKPHYIGDGHPRLNQKPLLYNGYLNPYYWIDRVYQLFWPRFSWNSPGLPGPQWKRCIFGHLFDHNLTLLITIGWGSTGQASRNRGFPKERLSIFNERMEIPWGKLR